MITLNLLSPEKRERLDKLINYFFVKELMQIVMLAMATLAVANILGWLVLNNFLNQLSNSTTLVNRDFSSYNQEIVKLNGAIKKLNQASQNFEPLAPTMAALAGALPNDIRLNAITIDHSNRALSIDGTAKTRAALLNYQEALKRTSWLGNFNAPVSQLFEKENIHFGVSASFKKLFEPTSTIDDASTTTTSL